MQFLICQTCGQLWRSAGLRSNQTYSQITLSDVNCWKPQLQIAKSSLVLGISYRNPTTNKCFYKIQGGLGGTPVVFRVGVCHSGSLAHLFLLSSFNMNIWIYLYYMGQYRIILYVFILYMYMREFFACLFVVSFY